MKVVVYAIAKNEESFVDRWVDSMGEADEICVLDTGSADGTVERLADRGVTVHQEVIRPWRFDVARNRSMELIPADADVCVCADLDEVFRPGWRAALERAWKPGTSLLRYRYIWSWRPDGTPGTTYWADKIHAPGVFRWVGPVHEVLQRTDGRIAMAAKSDELVVEHHPDQNKSRAGYLPLLELAVQENPDNDRNVHYLGREYMFRGRWDDAIGMLERHLSLKSAWWEPERCASMRFLSRCWLAKGDTWEGIRWALRAIAEAQALREPWVQAMEAAYAAEDWEAVVFFGQKAAAITERPESYISEDAAWGAYPWDMLAIAYWKLGRLGAATDAAQRALALEPDNERLRENLKFFREEAHA